MVLTVSSRSAKSDTRLLPRKEAFEHGFEVASTPETASYLCMRLDEDPRKELDEMRVLAGKHSDNVNKQRAPRGDFFGGEEIRDDVENLNYYLAKDALPLARAVQGEITMKVATSPEADLIRGYLVEGKLLDRKSGSAMDTMVNSWLVGNQWLSKGGKIHRTNNKGKILGLAPEEEFRQSVKDKNKGLEKSFKDKKVNLTVELLRYSAKPAVPVAEERKVAKEVVEPASEVRPDNEPGQGGPAPAA